jgi:HPt (histidine-containing phosphotransfer) domain-containing protein
MTPEPAIDLVHLARQTDADPALEEELLTMFGRQAEAILARLAATPPLSMAATGNMAHQLVGSALAIGAGRVAEAARTLEEMAGDLAKKERAGAGAGRLAPQAARPAILRLQAAVDEAKADIARLLS